HRYVSGFAGQGHPDPRRRRQGAPEAEVYRPDVGTGVASSQQGGKGIRRRRPGGQTGSPQGVRPAASTSQLQGGPARVGSKAERTRGRCGTAIPPIEAQRLGSLPDRHPSRWPLEVLSVLSTYNPRSCSCPSRYSPNFSRDGARGALLRLPPALDDRGLATPGSKNWSRDTPRIVLLPCPRTAYYAWMAVPTRTTSPFVVTNHSTSSPVA